MVELISAKHIAQVAHSFWFLLNFLFLKSTVELMSWVSPWCIVDWHILKIWEKNLTPSYQNQHYRINYNQNHVYQTLIQIWKFNFGCALMFFFKECALMFITPFVVMPTYNTKLYINVIALNDYHDIVSLDSGSIIWDCKINWFSGNSYPVGSKRRGVERCIYANGWW